MEDNRKVLSKINTTIELLDKKNQISAMDISDGKNTFEDLYRDKAFLLYMVLSERQPICWRTKKTMYDKELKDTFIVGVSTPMGLYLTELPIRYWGMFTMVTIPKALDDVEKNEDLSLLLLIINKELSLGGNVHVSC